MQASGHSVRTSKYDSSRICIPSHHPLPCLTSHGPVLPFHWQLGPLKVILFWVRTIRRLWDTPSTANIQLFQSLLRIFNPRNPHSNECVVASLSKSMSFCSMKVKASGRKATTNVDVQGENSSGRNKESESTGMIAWTEKVSQTSGMLAATHENILHQPTSSTCPSLI